MKNSRLKHFKHIYSEGFSSEFRQPCVVFCGHPSLRFGDVVHFIELWGSNSQHAIIFTEPDFPYLQALAPFQPLAMKAYYCPIETSLNFQQANKLLKELKPTVTVIPESYTQPPLMVPHKTDLVIEQTVGVRRRYPLIIPNDSLHQQTFTSSGQTNHNIQARRCAEAATQTSAQLRILGTGNGAANCSARSSNGHKCVHIDRATACQRQLARHQGNKWPRHSSKKYI